MMKAQAITICPPSEFSTVPQDLLSQLENAFQELSVAIERGATWTTDGPFRETEDAISAMKTKGLFAVEMEAAVRALLQPRARSPSPASHM